MITAIRALSLEGLLRELDDSPVSVEVAPFCSEARFDRVVAEAQQLQQSFVIVWMASKLVQEMDIFETESGEVGSRVPSKGLKVPILKRIFALVVPLSLQEPIDWSNAEGSCNYFGNELKLEHLQCLIHCLFKELDKRLKFLFSALSYASANRAHKHTDSDKDMAVDVDDLTLLLRCCVSLSMVDSSLVMENTQFILSVLGKLIALFTSGCSEKESVSFRKSISCECTYTDAGGTYVSEDFVASLCFLQPSNLWHPVLCALLEKFADELLMQRLLRKYFVAVDSASCTNERQCYARKRVGRFEFISTA